MHAAFSDAAAAVADAIGITGTGAACVSDVRGGFDAPARCADVCAAVVLAAAAVRMPAAVKREAFVAL